jgi:hypothetical protein
MVKKIILILITILIPQHIIYAKADTPKPGIIKSFSSPNKIYSIEIKILGYPDNSPSECTFKEKDKVIWTKELSTTPGLIEIANDGKYFILANWGWYDEGGYKSISFYNGTGELLKTIEFGAGKGRMRWISKTCISGDGNYYIAANKFENTSQITLYHVPTQTVVWDKNAGLEQIDNILISQNGNFILISTFDYQQHNIHFSYMDRTGNLLWKTAIDKGHSGNKDFIWLSEDGLSFKIYDLNKNKWLDFENVKGEIISR